MVDALLKLLQILVGVWWALWAIAWVVFQFWEPKPWRPSPLPPGEFTIRGWGRDEFLYYEGDRALTFYAELLVGPVNRSLDFNSIQQWMPPHENEPLTDEERERIFRNIGTCFDRNRTRYEVRR